MGRRWVCPTCSSGVNGPLRPRRDDACRYCLDCTAKRGRLVERRAPAAETAAEKRAAARALAREKAKAREVAKEAQYPNDLKGALIAYSRLDCWGKAGGARIRKCELELRRGTKEASTGSMWGARIVITAGKNRTDAHLLLLWWCSVAVWRTRDTQRWNAKEVAIFRDAAFYELTGQPPPLSSPEKHAAFAVYLDWHDEHPDVLCFPGDAHQTMRCLVCHGSGEAECSTPDCGCAGFHPCLHPTPPERGVKNDDY